MTMLDKALALASEGFRVFPLSPGGKTPALELDWKRIATRDPERIRALWWEPVMEVDQPYNIGIATGDGLVVVDVDVRDGKQGEQSLRLLQALNDDLPATLEARTATGGRHLYFQSATPLGNSASRLADGIDTRGEGGFVVAPGSIVDGVEYEWTERAARAAVPEWLGGMIGAPRPPKEKSAAPLADEDDPHAVARAIAWLRDKAPDHGTYQVAAKVKDFGVSEAMCGELMLEHWRDARELGKDDEHVLFRVRNAYQYGQNPIGVLSPEADFGPVDLNESDLKPGVLTWDDVSQTEPREWLYGDKLLRRYVSLLVSPGGVGKTAWTTVAALALASNRALLHDKPHKALRVWLYNLEDDMDEVKRRLRAAAEYHDIPPEVIAANIRANSGRDRGLKLVKSVNDTFVTLPDKDKLIAAMKQDAIDVLIVDPFLRSHSVPENSNEAQDKVLNIYSDIAEATRAAILLIHHTKKGAVAGDPESARGGSSQVGGARKVMTMAAMTPEEADKLDVREEERRLHVRIDDGKQNMSPPATVAEWLKLASVSLHNGTPEYPNGDNVQVVRKWTPPDPWLGVTPDQIEDCLAAIEKGLPGGDRYTAHKRSTERWVVPLIASMLEKSESLAGQILAKWRSSGILVEEEYLSPSQRRSAKGLFRRKEGLV